MRRTPEPRILVIDDEHEAGDALARSIGARADVTVAAPGEMAFAVTPYLARELAQDMVRPTMPILAAA